MASLTKVTETVRRRKELKRRTNRQRKLRRATQRARQAKAKAS